MELEALPQVKVVVEVVEQMADQQRLGRLQAVLLEELGVKAAVEQGAVQEVRRRITEEPEGLEEPGLGEAVEVGVLLLLI